MKMLNHLIQFIRSSLMKPFLRDLLGNAVVALLFRARSRWRRLDGPRDTGRIMLFGSATGARDMPQLLFQALIAMRVPLARYWMRIE